MINVSQAQLIDVWCDLEDAYNGCNIFGGDTAEIYAYKLYEARPSAIEYMNSSRQSTMQNTMMEDVFKEVTLKASISLYNILNLFMEKRDCCIVIDDRKFGKWFMKELFHHRVHVKIIRTKK